MQVTQTGKYKYRFWFFDIGGEGGRWGINLKYETILNTVNSCYKALGHASKDFGPVTVTDFFLKNTREKG